MGLRRRKAQVVEQEPQIDPEAESLLRSAEAVMGFRHRLDTDTDFRQSFGGAIKEAIARSEAKAAREADAHAEDFGGNSVLGQELTERAKAAKGDLVESILGLFRWVAETEEFDAEDFVRGLREDVGMAINKAYSEGLEELPTGLADKRSLGMYHRQEGLIIPVERYDPATNMASLQEQSRQWRETTRNFFDEQGGN